MDHAQHVCLALWWLGWLELATRQCGCSSAVKKYSWTSQAADVLCKSIVAALNLPVCAVSEIFQDYTPVASTGGIRSR